VPNFLFLALWCVLANVSQNCNGTWQRHNWAVCFGKRQKITVSYSKFSLLICIRQNSQVVWSTEDHQSNFTGFMQRKLL
jgi:hypothetical protein